MHGMLECLLHHVIVANTLLGKCASRYPFNRTLEGQPLSSPARMSMAKAPGYTTYLPMATQVGSPKRALMKQWAALVHLTSVDECSGGSRTQPHNFAAWLGLRLTLRLLAILSCGAS